MNKSIRDMTKKEYIRYRKKHRDYIWDQMEKHYYISYKNQDYIFYAIIIEPFLFIMNNGILYCILVIIIFWIKSNINNEELDKSPKILEERKSSIEYRIKYEGEF